jgi:hypothetical protein
VSEELRTRISRIIFGEARTPIDEPAASVRRQIVSSVTKAVVEYINT